MRLFCSRQVFKFPGHLVKVCEGGGADIGAVGVTEIEQIPVTAETCFGEGRTTVIYQAEGRQGFRRTQQQGGWSSAPPWDWPKVQ
jgi:hypothetical protein